MSRLRFLTLLTALVALSTAFAACGGGDSDDPAQVLDDATLEGVESGSLDVFVDVKSEGEDGGDLDVSISGPFQSKEGQDLPELAIEASAKGTSEGEPVDFEGGLTLLSDRAFVNYEGTDYELDPTSFGLFRQSFEQAQNQGSEGNAADVTACQEAAEGMEFGDFFVDDLTSEDGVEVDGTSTTKVSGNLDTAGALDAIIELAEDPACSAQLESGQLPIDELEEAKGELTDAVKKAHIEVYVGDDDIVRKAAAEVTIEPKDTSGEKVEVEFGLELSGVNDPQEISGPAKAKPIQDLFQKLGVNPIELLESASTGEGLGELLEGLTEGLLDGDSSSGGSDGSGGAGGGGGKQAYLECLKGARTPADLQQCASMIQ